MRRGPAPLGVRTRRPVAVTTAPDPCGQVYGLSSRAAPSIACDPIPSPCGQRPRTPSTAPALATAVAAPHRTPSRRHGRAVPAAQLPLSTRSPLRRRRLSPSGSPHSRGTTPELLHGGGLGGRGTSEVDPPARRIWPRAAWTRKPTRSRVYALSGSMRAASIRNGSG